MSELKESERVLLESQEKAKRELKPLFPVLFFAHSKIVFQSKMAFHQNWSLFLRIIQAMPKCLVQRDFSTLGAHP